MIFAGPIFSISLTHFSFRIQQFKEVFDKERFGAPAATWLSAHMADVVLFLYSLKRNMTTQRYLMHVQHFLLRAHSCNTTDMLSLMRDLHRPKVISMLNYFLERMHRPGGADSGKFYVSRMNKRWPAHQNRFA